MIIKFNGETSLSKLPELVKEVTKDIQERAGIPASKFKIKDAQIGVVFKVGSEMKYMAVEHDGVAEIFQVQVQLDDKGNIKKTVDNEEESFVDEYTRAVAKGLESPVTEEIESVYNLEELEEVARDDAGDLVAVYYNHKETTERVVQYFRNGVLVAEMGYKNKEREA